MFHHHFSPQVSCLRNLRPQHCNAHTQPSLLNPKPSSGPSMDPNMHIAAPYWSHGAASHRLLGDYHFSPLTTHMAKSIGATIGVIFLISTAAYIVASALNHCLRHGRHRLEGDEEAGHAEVVLRLDQHVATVKALPVVVYAASGEVSSSGGDEGCPVCLEEYASGDEVRVLPDCSHCFHRECIDQWLLAHKLTCPMCRGVVTGAKEARP